jgi:hypothetical protein
MGKMIVHPAIPRLFLYHSQNCFIKNSLEIIFKNLLYSKLVDTSSPQKGVPDNKITGLEFLSINERINSKN